MTLDPFRPQMQRVMQPVVDLIRKVGITPNALTIASFLVSALAGIAFYAGGVVLGTVGHTAGAVSTAGIVSTVAAGSKVWTSTGGRSPPGTSLTV